MSNNTEKINSRLGYILFRVSSETGVSIEDIQGKSRKDHIVIARQIYMYCARQLTKYSLQIIGDFIDRKHSTVIGSCKVVEAAMDTNSEVKIVVSNVINEVRAYSTTNKAEFLRLIIDRYQKELDALENL